MSRRHTSRTDTDPSEAAATALAPANKHLAAQKLAAAVRPVFELLEGRQLLNGALDPTFGVAGKAVTDFGGAQDIGSGLAVLADGSFVVVGESGGQFAVAKYTANGALDTGFGGGDGLVTTAIGSIARATSVAIDGSGRIVVGGYATVGTTEDFAVARYDAGGNLDTSFRRGDGVATTDFANRRDNLFALKILPSGQLVAVGQVRTGAADNNEDFGVAVYHPATGVLDTTFDTDGKATTDFGGEEDARGVAYDAALGRIVVVGESDGTFALAGYVAATGALDGGFDGDGRLTTIFPGSAIAMSAAVDSNGRYVVAGGSGADFAVARYANTGALDAGFDSDGMLTLDFAGGFDHANAVALAADGKILVAGVASNGGSGDFGVARLTSSGALDTTFGLGTGKVTTDIAGNSDTAAAVAVQPTSGKLLVVGTGNGGGASQDDFATV